jgi:hypothetical protein
VVLFDMPSVCRKFLLAGKAADLALGAAGAHVSRYGARAAQIQPLGVRAEPPRDWAVRSV